MLLRLSGLAQASGTPMRMLAIARTTLKNKRASRSQLSQVFWIFPTFSDDGKRSCAGSTYGSREGGGGFGGRRDQKGRNRLFFVPFFCFFKTFPDFQKAPGAAEAHRFLKNKGPLFGSFFSRRPFGLVKHNGLGTFFFLHF